MARWNGNTLMHKWYGSDREDEVAYWDGTPDKSGRGSLFYDSIDRTVRFLFYTKPTAEEAFARILNYQNG